MGVLFFFILSMVSVSYVQSELPPCVICAYKGSNGNGSFKLEDVPERCEAILYGGNFFNIEPSKEDTDAITALKKAGKPVYMLYLYGKDGDGFDLVELACPNKTKNLDQYMTPMISYLKNNKIDGVLFGFLHMNNGDVPADYDTKISEFLCKIKGLLPSIIVGIILPGWQSDQWGSKDVFDFSETNPNVDFYMIDSTSSGADCYANTTSTGGRFPTTSNNPNVASLDDICSGVSGSGMDVSKVMINLAVFATQVDASGSEISKPYSEYCRRNPKELWCADNMQLMYHEVVFLKKLFKGIMLSYVDTDDVDNVCKCGKCPVLNNFIDAWQKKPITCCDAIS